MHFDWRLAAAASVVTTLLPAPLPAQSVALPTEFPSEARPAAAQALRELLQGRVFRAQPASGPGWRLEYKDSGFVFLDTTTGYRDTGRWSVQESSLCTQWERSPSGCSEARLSGATLYIKRISNGEVVALRAE